MLIYITPICLDLIWHEYTVKLAYFAFIAEAKNLNVSLWLCIAQM